MIKLFDFLRAVKGFFPIHLLFSHLKSNLLVLFYWVFLFSIINSSLGIGLGLPYLFMSPEYLGETSYMSFVLLGFSIGGFIMAYHTYSYIQLGPRYPFIATLSRPFFKFCINNSLVPLIFIINLVFNIVEFQRSQELNSNSEIFILVLSFVVGISLFISISFLYFFPTNKDLFKITGKKSEDFNAKSSNVNATLHRKQSWYKYFLKVKLDRYYYIGKGFKIKQSRSSMHYDREV